MCFGFIPRVGVSELIIILLIIFVVFGAGKLPVLGRAVGQSIREFKTSLRVSEEDKGSENL